MNEQNNGDAMLEAEALARDILQMARNNLVVHLRFLDAALSRLRLVSNPMGGFSVDGWCLRYNALQVLRAYREERENIPRSYLHMVFHCVFHHAFGIRLVDRAYWDLAADIAVESVIADLNLSAITTARQKKQADYISDIRRKVKAVTAEHVYRYLQDSKVGVEELARLHKLFHTDDHDLWYQEPGDEEGDSDHTGAGDEDNPADQPPSGGEDQKQDSKDRQDGKDPQDGKGGLGDEDQKGKSGKKSQGKQQKSQKPKNAGSGAAEEGQSGQARQSLGADRAKMAEDWEGVAQRMQMDMEAFQQGKLPAGMLQNLKAVTREKYDYTRFLQKFAVMGEVMHVNDQEFDYIFYTLGLQLFGRMPLIEPLEYRDEKRVREMVIAIDTSGSVQGDLVQRFLQKTYNILMQEQSFFNRINIHIIQCDAAVQEDKKITSQEEMDRYVKEMKFHGFGGTDFRPVFRLVETHRRSGEIQNLRGLIYFTDGYGTFPEQPPDYPTAFVFVGDEDDAPAVPPWAIKLLLRPEDIRNNGI